MSTTIDSLDIQIKTSAASAAQSIDFLATKLEKLRNNAKLTTVCNNLGKLKKALEDMSGTSGAISDLKELSNAMQSLSTMPKMTGMTSALNSLKKIPEIVNSLDAVTLEKFRKQMEKLADALAPLATRINEVAKGFSKLPSKVSSAVTATNRMASASQNAKAGFDMSSLGLFAMIQNYESLIGVVNQAIQAVSSMLSQAIEWDGIQFRFGRAFGEDAEETYAWIQKINDALGINIQEFMQYSSLYGSLLSGFGMEQKKITAISVGLTELSYDIWAAYNDRFKSLEDASEAVRSAITGEIEPIRNAGIALTEASLQEFIDSTHLAGVSIEKLTEAQKSEVRYAAMVNAAMNQGIVGTYAREMNTAEGAVRSLSQSFKGLVQALGSLFIPLLQVIVPYVTAFVELITDAVFWLAKLLGIPIQKIDWGTPSKGVGGIADGAKEAASGLDSASKAAKKLKSYTMGFDELNVINPDSGSGGAGGGAGGAGGSGWGEGLDLKSLWDESIFAQASKKVDELKQKILDFVDKWKWAFALAGAVMTGFMAHKMWSLFANSTFGAALIGGIKKVIDTVKTFFTLLKEGAPFVDTLAATFPKIANFVAKIKGAISAVTGFIAGLTGPAWATIAAVITAVASVVYFLYKNWEEVTEAVKKFFKENIAPKLEEIGSHFSDIKEATGKFGEAMAQVWKVVKDFFAGIDWSKLSRIGTTFEVIGGIIFSVVGAVIATAFNILMGVIENAIQAFTGLYQITAGVVKFLVALFTGDFSSIVDIVQLVAEGIQNLWDGMVGFVIDIVSDFVDGIISWFTNLWDELVGHSIVPDTVEGIIDWFLKLPDKILGPIEDFTEDVLKIFKDLWENTKTWWSSNVQPKFTKEYWRNKFDTIRTAIRDKLAEVKTAIIEKWNDVKGWFNSNVAPKLTTKYWTDKFAGIKEGFLAVVKNMVNAGIDRLNGFIDSVNSALKLEWDAFSFLGKEIFPSGSFTLAVIPKIPRFENGGFIEDGLFTMNRGEIAGKFNNGKSVVANNEQIIAGISEGVYSAVVAAMSETQRGGEQPVVVYLDGKQIYSNIKRTEARRGANLMGNQVGYVY